MLLERQLKASFKACMTTGESGGAGVTDGDVVIVAGESVGEAIGAGEGVSVMSFISAIAAVRVNTD
jgi:hypothetical protein